VNWSGLVKIRCIFFLDNHFYPKTLHAIFVLVFGPARCLCVFRSMPWLWQALGFGEKLSESGDFLSDFSLPTALKMDLKGWLISEIVHLAYTLYTSWLGWEIIQRMDTTGGTQNYFAAKEALWNNRETLSVFPSAGDTGCINRDLEVCWADELRDSKHMWQGHALSLQSALECKSHRAVCYGAGLLSETCMYFVNETQAKLRIISAAAAVGDHTCLAGRSILPCFCQPA